MPKAFPKEFREDVIRVYRDSDASMAQVAKDFGISPSCLKRWLAIDERNSSRSSGGSTPAIESDALREANKRIKLLEQENEVLRRAAAYLSQANLPKMMYPLVRELAAKDAPLRMPVAVTCRVLKITRQPYYRWLKCPVTNAELTEAYRANALFDAHQDDPEFGYRFLLDEARDAGQPMAERTAWKICSQLGWWSAFGKKRGRNGKKAGPPVHDDLVMRDFTADAPNELWLADITEHWTREGKLYLCAVKDVYSNRIVGYSIDSRMKSRIAVAALDNAVARRGGVAGCVLHTDRGSQFRSRKLVHQLNRHQIVGSMGRVGAAGDNAAMESFFSLLQKNVLNRRTWNTGEELRIAIVTWIERTYHRRRRQAALGRLTPVEYELIMTTTATRAA
ncbi:IS3 family transposase [Microbacterium sp. ARD31]|uniref:IS3 family transposase n=1 Tax=Microbacterium sp. ARD31 TaxID=2962576 RepID=UPI0028814FB2|nr:IS3 family transposase [Microbacterium sp. ARD31]MDT0187846.1 IS3 family transposase [Microbacterium sp. ARD31]